MFQKIKKYYYSLAAALIMFPSRVMASGIDISPPDDPTGLDVGQTGIEGVSEKTTSILSNSKLVVEYLTGVLFLLLTMAAIRNFVILALNGSNPNTRQDAIKNIIYCFVGIAIVGSAWMLGGLFMSVFL